VPSIELEEVFPLNVAPLLAEAVGLPLLRSEAHEPARALLRDDPELQDLISEGWIRALLEPVTLAGVEGGEVGLFRTSAEMWRTLVRDSPTDGVPGAKQWIEAADLSDGDLLVYPNGSRDQPQISVFAPVRVDGRGTLLVPMTIHVKGPKRLATRMQLDKCTEMIEGELDEREIVCVETGCEHQNCTRSFYRKGVEIIECMC
jgi:hypothetical protein